MFRNFVLSLSLLISLHAYSYEERPVCAGSAFSNIYIPTNLLDRELIGNAPPLIGCEGVDPFSRVVKDVNEILKGRFDLPEVGIHLLPKSDKAMYLDLVTIPTSLAIDGYEKHPNLTLYAFAHEYGHAIFRTGLLNDEYFGPSWGDYHGYAGETHQFQIQGIEKRMHLINASYEIDKYGEGSDDHERLKELIRNLKEEISRIKQEAELQVGEGNPHIIEWMSADQVNSPYNELFADIVAVLYSYRGDAVYDALFRTRKWSENWLGYQEDMKARDFTERSNRIDVWKVKKDIYGIFSPVRYHLFENYLDEHLRPDKDPAFRGKFLALVFKSIKRAMIQTTEDFNAGHGNLNPWMNPYESISDIEVVELNKKLITLIDYALLDAEIFD